ncbi:MAG: calcium-binding protein [Rhizobiaceae bacterium]|nr:MAG: calcium-binding protein [Rhizobiaceae bacterium]
MKTVDIGNRTETYIIPKGNTTYVLAKNDTAEAVGNRVIYLSEDLQDVAYRIEGRIEGQTGIYVNTYDPAAGTVIDIMATGRIVATQDGIDIDGDGHLVRNDGRIVGLGGDGISAVGSHTIINSGNISGKYAAIYLSTSTGDESLVRNSGVLAGESFAIRANAGADKIINSGTITGDVLLGSGDDTFVFLSGRVEDQVIGGAGDDTFILRKPGVDVYEYNGADQGTDLVKAAFSMSLSDNVENLTLIGKGNFTGIGNEIANTLVGNSGANTMIGGLGDDILKGGRGNDVLIGGEGKDEFHFARGTGMDIVTDYAWANDEIHLEGLKGATDYADMLANHVELKDNDVWITYGNDVIVLADSDLADLSADYFIFN